MVGFAGELGRCIGCQRCQTVSLHDAGVILVSLCDQSAKHQFGESRTRTRAHGHPYRNRGLLADFAAAFNFASKNCEARNLFQSFDQPHIRAALHDEEHTMLSSEFSAKPICVSKCICGNRRFFWRRFDRNGISMAHPFASDATSTIRFAMSVHVYARS